MQAKEVSIWENSLKRLWTDRTNMSYDTPYNSYFNFIATFIFLAVVSECHVLFYFILIKKAYVSHDKVKSFWFQWSYSMYG